MSADADSPLKSLFKRIKMPYWETGNQHVENQHPKPQHMLVNSCAFLFREGGVLTVGGLSHIVKVDLFFCLKINGAQQQVGVCGGKQMLRIGPLFVNKNKVQTGIGF